MNVRVLEPTQADLMIAKQQPPSINLGLEFGVLIIVCHLGEGTVILGGTYMYKRRVLEFTTFSNNVYAPIF